MKKHAKDEEFQKKFSKVINAVRAKKDARVQEVESKARSVFLEKKQAMEQMEEQYLDKGQKYKSLRESVEKGMVIPKHLLVGNNQFYNEDRIKTSASGIVAFVSE